MKKIIFAFLLIFSCLGTHAQQGIWNDKGLIELTPAESIVYKYVLAMDTESQKVINDLYATLKNTGDKSLIECTETGAGGWYVKKDYPLPEGNYFESDIYNAKSPEDSHAFDSKLLVVFPQFNCYVNWRGRVENLLEYLGDQVTADYISKPDLSGGITCHLTCNLKTSSEALELGMRVHDINMEGVRNFHSQCFLINKTYNSHLISVMTESNKEDNLVYSMNWEGADAGAPRDAEADWYVEGTDEGIAIVNPEKKEFAGQAWAFINAGGFSLEANHDYIVRLTMKVPSDGTYVVNMGSGEANRSCEVPVTASDDFQVIDVQFPEFLSEQKDTHYDPIDGSAHIILNGGWVAGTTVVKKVEVYEIKGSGARGGTTAIDTVKAADGDGPVYNLAGQKVGASYKGIVIQNGKKRIVR